MSSCRAEKSHLDAFLQTLALSHNSNAALAAYASAGRDEGLSLGIGGVVGVMGEEGEPWQEVSPALVFASRSKSCPRRGRGEERERTPAWTRASGAGWRASISARPGLRSTYSTCSTACVRSGGTRVGSRASGLGGVSSGVSAGMGWVDGALVSSELTSAHTQTKLCAQPTLGDARQLVREHCGMHSLAELTSSV